MMKVEKLLHEAANIARCTAEPKTFFFGAIGIRKDGVSVRARNGFQPFPTPEHHCEVRLARKLTLDSIVYLARIDKQRIWRLSKPCSNCERVLRNKGIARVYYTIRPNEWGTLSFR